MTPPLIEEPKPNLLLLEALEQRWKNYRAELKRCRAEFSNEAVHDLRVATRRMLALIQLLNSISPRPRSKTSSMNLMTCAIRRSCLPKSPKLFMSFHNYKVSKSTSNIQKSDCCETSVKK